MPISDPNSGEPAGVTLQRRLGVFDATTAVVGGIVGAGIFMNPSVVARAVGSPFLILAAWGLGGVLALFGAWVYAELGSERPAPGGQYAYFREAYHPLLAFLYGWGLLWVVQSGGMAAVAVTFAQYMKELVGWSADDRLVAAGALLGLTVVNCFGVRAGASTQSALTVLKSISIAALVICGFAFAGAPAVSVPSPIARGESGSAVALASAMVPVMFAYGGWQTACFLAGEIREPTRNLPRALMIGIAAVIVLYLATNVACLRNLGAGGLAATSTPASDVMRRALGEAGARAIAVGIVVSTFGFLSQGMLTTPRVYYAMANDGLFFATFGRVDPRTGAPVAAVILQGVAAVAIAFSGTYERILNYVVSVDFVFYALAAGCVFVFRRRATRLPPFRAPGHPWTTALFGVGCLGIVVTLVLRNPADSLRGLGILALGVPVYCFWKRGKAV